VGFEPTVGCPTHDFQSCRFGRSRTPPRLQPGQANGPDRHLWANRAVEREHGFRPRPPSGHLSFTIRSSEVHFWNCATVDQGSRPSADGGTDRSDWRTGRRVVLRHSGHCSRRTSVRPTRLMRRVACRTTIECPPERSSSGPPRRDGRGRRAPSCRGEEPLRGDPLAWTARRPDAGCGGRVLRNGRS
jgi:hypothetical protein